MVEDEINQAIQLIKENKEAFRRAITLQEKVWNGEKVEIQPLLLSCQPDENINLALPLYDFEEIHYDKQKMFASQIRASMSAVFGGAQAVPSVRANMGCGIFATLFGVKQELFKDKMPWVREHLSKDQIARMEPSDLKISDDFKMGLEHMAYMAHRLEGTGCMVYPMDLQGPFDIAHLVYGDAIFYDLYDDPEFIHHLLELACQAIFMGMEECLKVLPDSDKYLAHYNGLVIPRSIGGIKTSEDTSTLLSKDHINEFIIPYLKKVLSMYGGGYVHYCGKNPHLFESIIGMPEVKGINFGNPEKHDMEYILKRCAENGKIFYGSIPKRQEESARDYFLKYLAASRIENRSILLLTYSCAEKDQEAVLNDWEYACSYIFGSSQTC
jgi:hypothetical protein